MYSHWAPIVVRLPFLPTHIRSVRPLHRPTYNWPGQPPVGRVAVPLCVARVEPPSAGRAVGPLSAVRVVESLSADRGAEPPSVGRGVEPLLLAGATTEAFGMAPEGASGTGVGGHMV